MFKKKPRKPPQSREERRAEIIAKREAKRANPHARNLDLDLMDRERVETSVLTEENIPMISLRSGVPEVELEAIRLLRQDQGKSPVVRYRLEEGVTKIEEVSDAQ